MIRPIVLRQTDHTNGSGAALARAMGIEDGRPGYNRTGTFDRYVINWGVTQRPSWAGNLIMSNSAEAVANCSNKTETFRLLDRAHVPTLEWTTNRFTAAGWRNTDGTVIARTIVSGDSGRGLLVVREGEFPLAPLYTRFYKSDAEYRVHVAFGKVILIQQKKKKNGHRFVGDQSVVRTVDDGWVFAIHNLDADARSYRTNLSAIGLKAAKALGANHCAVDILVRHSDNDMVVCEVNSAPSIKGYPTPIEKYKEAFTAELRKLGWRPNSNN